MKRIFPLLVAFLVFSGGHAVWAGTSYDAIKSDSDLQKASSWRRNAPYVPPLGIGLGFGIMPAYYAPYGAEAKPYVTSSLSIRSGLSAGMFGATGYWSDLYLNLSWGLSKALTDNVGSTQMSYQTYIRDIGIGLSKVLFRERNTGIVMAFSLSGRIPISIRSRYTTLITSLAPGISLSKSFFLGRLSLGYSFGANFNFFQQDAPLYNPDLAGIPRVNSRWGMSHSFSAGIGIVKGLRLGLGVSFSAGYSFADNYTNPDGPQVYGADKMTKADLASYAMNVGNSYGIGISLSYRLNRYLSFSVSYRNGGRQFEYREDDKGNVVYVVRNPFKLQNGSFSIGISGRL